MSRFKKLCSNFVDYPLCVSVVILVGVVAHFLSARVWPSVNVAAALAGTDANDALETLTALALGVAGVSAMVGGFAGVVVVFGLGSENDRFRLLRRKGARRLRANWISVVLSSFAGAFGALISAVLVVGFNSEAGMWVLELCILITAHAAVRLTALLAGLAKVVDSEDNLVDQQRRTVATSELIPGMPPNR